MGMVSLVGGLRVRHCLEKGMRTIVLFLLLPELRGLRP
jgi:hypothetical protein